MFNVDPATLAVLIPIIAVLGGMAIAVVSVIYQGRKDELKHKERIIAMEKGLPIPEEPVSQPKKDSRFVGLLAWGLVIALASLGIIVSVSVAEGVENGLYGLIPMGVGLGFLIAAFASRKSGERD